MADVVQQGGASEDQSRFGIQFVQRGGLVENLQGEPGDCIRMFLFEKIFLTETSRRFDDLFAVDVFLPIPQLRQEFQQNSILQTDAWNNNLIDTRLLHDFVKNNCGWKNDVGAIGTKTQIPNPLLDSCCAKFFDQALQFLRSHFLAAVLIEQLFQQLA